MAKTAVKDSKQASPRILNAQPRSGMQASVLPSKDVVIKNYLDKFYPGWDTYLKNKNN